MRVTTSSGSVAIVAEDRSDVVVEKGSPGEVEPDGTTAFKGKSSPVALRCPAGSDVVVGTSSGSIRLHGRFGEVRATTSSGSIEIEGASGADLRTNSGKVSIGACDRTCRVATSSGRIEVGSASEADVRTKSGRVDVGAATAQVRTVSAAVTVRAGAGDVAVQSVSGRVTVTLPPGRRPAIDARTAKAPRIEVEQGDDGVVRAAIVSGRLTICSA